MISHRVVPTRAAGRLLILAALLCCLAPASQAREVLLRATVGALNDWALRIDLDRPADTSPYAGPFNLRHTGICTTKDHNTKVGTATADVRGNSLYDLVLKFDDEDCVVAGPVKLTPDGERNVMRCGRSKQVPLITWSDAP